jgi:hypothetical protein
MTNTISRVLRYLVIGLGIQQVLYGMYYDTWIDFSQFSWTTLFFELLYVSYLVSSAISESAIGPMKFKKVRKDFSDNYFTPKQ